MNGSPLSDLSSGVSVIIPTRNRAHLVGRAVRSVLAQTAPPGEVIVVDDCSEDDTPAILQGFGEAIRVIRADQNIERGAARNLGARGAEGDLLAFLDSDDEWEPEKLEAQLSSSDPPGASITGIAYMDEESRPTGRVYLPPIDAPRNRVRRGNPFLGSPSSLLLPRHAMEQIGGFREERPLQGSEDWVFLATLSEQGWPISVVSQILVRFRLHPGQSTAPARSLARSMWTACDWLDQQRLGSDIDARARRNYASTAISAAFARERDWPQAARWGRRALASGQPSARARSGWRIARSTLGGIVRPQ